ncbi:MAG: FmdB family zinc ribbon protein [Pseudomonadota bacterium]
MPIYEYRCQSCGFQKEFLQKVGEPLLTTCPDCGQEAFQKLLSAAGFQLKGSGWYATDFKGGAGKPKTESSESASTGHGCAAGACGCAPKADA